MDTIQQQKAARDFATRWQGKGYEKGESQIFWVELLTQVFDIQNPSEFLHFEQQVKIDHTSFIDAYIPRTHTMIEQKSIEKDLGTAIRQSDGTLLNPFQQAKRYAAELPYSQRPRWIVTCNFREFWVYDMEQPNGEPQKILLKDLEKDYYRLQFLVDEGNEHLKREMEVSVKAGELVGVIYDKLFEQYGDAQQLPRPACGEGAGGGATTEDILRSLNILCVRLVFCLYAEDAGLFPTRTYFHDYLASFPANRIRKALIDLFEVLDTPLDQRDPYLDEDLAAFPYVNGGLFGKIGNGELSGLSEGNNSPNSLNSQFKLIIPQFNDDLKNLLLEKASADFDWSEISPTIFGAVFESTLNPETRRSGGMHYTSIENIHKVIDPLFLNDLRAEFYAIIGNENSHRLNRSSQIEQMRNESHKSVSSVKSAGNFITPAKRQALAEFQNKLASLTFFDPACGSGNFLTETFLSLRRLENEVIQAMYGDTRQLGFEGTIKVNISQFYGIEINDFACTVAKTALWIAESQTLKETSSIVGVNLNFLPLKTNAYIHEGNALRTDWAGLFNQPKLADTLHYPDYIIGNPPFVGIRHSSENHRQDLKEIVSVIPKSGCLDYVTAWYIKAAELMQLSPKTRTAFVSTNSITQGEQATILWRYLLENQGLNINFAYQTFKWVSESNGMAAVHCVIIGFSKFNEKNWLFTTHGKQQCISINQYLLDAPTIWIDKRKAPLSAVPEMIKGCYPTDGGNYIFTKDEKTEFLKLEPKAEPYFRRWIGADDMLNNGERWILFLKGISPTELRAMPYVMERVKNVRETRSKSTKEATRKKADTPLLLDEERIPTSDFLVMPVVSSENRRYIPLSYQTPPDICYASCFFIENADMYLFGILNSNVHNAWMRAVCGRLKSDYRYSNTIVYNNFPFPQPNDKQRAQIEQTAKAILAARALYPDSSLADLYDETAMPPELRRAHQENDKAVMQAYGFKIGMTESDCVAELFKMYQQLVKEREK